MHLLENTLLTFDLRFKVIENIAQYPLHHVPYTHVKFEMLCQMVKEKMHLQENAFFCPTV